MAASTYATRAISMSIQASEPLIIDDELLRRFGGRGPRSSSSPAADRFDARGGAER